MTGEGRVDAARQELVLAQEELRVAGSVLSAGSPRIALTRAYFAAFHAVRGLLYAHGYEPRSHGGVQSLFSLHFIKQGTFDSIYARLFARLQKYREEADYAQAFVIDHAGAQQELAAAAELVDKIRELIESSPS